MRARDQCSIFSNSTLIMGFCWSYMLFLTLVARSYALLQ